MENVDGFSRTRKIKEKKFHKFLLLSKTFTGIYTVQHFSVYSKPFFH